MQLNFNPDIINAYVLKILRTLGMLKLPTTIYVLDNFFSTTDRMRKVCDLNFRICTKILYWVIINVTRCNWQAVLNSLFTKLLVYAADYSVAIRLICVVQVMRSLWVQQHVPMTFTLWLSRQELTQGGVVSTDRGQSRAANDVIALQPIFEFLDTCRFDYISESSTARMKRIWQLAAPMSQYSVMFFVLPLYWALHWYLMCVTKRAMSPVKGRLETDIKYLSVMWCVCFKTFGSYSYKIILSGQLVEGTSLTSSDAWLLTSVVDDL